jgi:hypothetical protein
VLRLVPAGWWLALGHTLTGIALCISIIGIPLGLASFKLGPRSGSCRSARRSSRRTSPSSPAKASEDPQAPVRLSAGSPRSGRKAPRPGCTTPGVRLCRVVSATVHHDVMNRTEQLLAAVAERAAVLTREDGSGCVPPAPVQSCAVVRAQETLGFALPPLLSGLDLGVADGGFGPGYGLWALERSVATYADERAPSGADDWPWPEGVLPVGDWGCAMLACVDCRAEGLPVLLFEPNAGEPDSAWYVDAPSLEGWLRTWLAGTGWYEDPLGDADLPAWAAYRSRISAG